MQQDNKAVVFQIENGKLVIAVDPNKDGQPVASITVDLNEVPDEVLALLRKK